ncbi:MAG TPA: SDR family NAD(P)-dependent oxidoreductase [Acidimicrobiales bacterium]|nr:SDR family NAD(P)-dependent oxidoreductase [Acidimicrobiales bacterium]
MAAEFEIPWREPPGGRLAGKVAIVTGAGSDGPLPGIGVATAALFALHGASVGVVDISGERAANTVELIGRAGGASTAIVADITRGAECARAVEQVVQRYGRLDVLVNNAAITGAGLAGVPYEEAWDRVVALDLTAVMLMSRQAAPHLQAGGGGAIVNMSSIAAIRGMGGGAYGPAKAGVIGLTYDLAYTYGRDGIRVNCIAPGHLYTPMGDQGGPELRERRRRAGLLGTEGTAWDAAWAALFLASDEARWITGAVLPVDAGTTATTALGIDNLELRAPGPATAPGR